MALTLTNNYLETLVNAGADAQQNLFVAQFFFQNASPNSTEGNAEAITQAMTVRCTSFDPPQVAHDGKYTNKFLTAYIPRPAAKVNVTRKFDLSFRVDSNYLLYQKLLLQQNVTFNAAKSYVATDIQTLSDHDMSRLFDVEIYSVPYGITSIETYNLGAENNGLKLYGFRNCWITGIDPLPFSDQAGPQSVKLSCSFIEMEDQQSVEPMYPTATSVATS